MGDFWEATGLGASVRGLFSTDGVPMVRWASADLGSFSIFFAFLDRFLPVFGPYFALFPSMSCAYLYVHNFLPTNVSVGEGNRGNDEIRPVRRSPQGEGGEPTRRRPDKSGLWRAGMTNQIRNPNDERQADKSRVSSRAQSRDLAVNPLRSAVQSALARQACRGLTASRAVAGGRSRTPARGAVAPWRGKPAGA